MMLHKIMRYNKKLNQIYVRNHMLNNDLLFNEFDLDRSKKGVTESKVQIF